MSLAAASMLRSRSNWTVMAVAPSELVEVIWETPGNLGDLAFERLRDRRGHGLRRGARQRCRNRDRRKVDLRQRGDRKRRKRNEADEEDRDHHQRCRDRAMNEGSGNAAEHRRQLPLAGVDGHDRPRLQQKLARRHDPVTLFEAFGDRPPSRRPVGHLHRRTAARSSSPIT